MRCRDGKGVIATIIRIKKLTAAIMSLAFIALQLPSMIYVADNDAFNAKDDILMKVGSPAAFYQRNEIPIDPTDNNVYPYRDGDLLYVPLEFIAHCMNEKLTVDITEVGRYSIGDTDINAAMKDGKPYITANKAEQLMGKRLIENDECIIFSADPNRTGYDTIIQKLENDFENTYHLTPDESKGRVLANVWGSLWGASSDGNNNDVGELNIQYEDVDSLKNEAVFTLTTKKKTSNPNYLNFRFFNSDGTDVKIRDVGTISFYAKNGAGTSDGKIAVTLQDDKYNSVFSQELILGDSWRKYELTFKSNKNIAKDSRRLFIALGYKAQTVKISAFKAVVYPDSVYNEYDFPQSKLTYIGEENEDENAWLNDVVRKIKQSREKSAQISVVDDEGNPIKNASFELTMENHLFNLGTEVSQFYVTNPGWSTTTQWDVLPESENIENFHRTLKEYFNTAVPGNAYKWASWRGRKSDSDKCADLLGKMGIRMRGHCLWWDSVSFFSSNADDQQAFSAMSRDEQNKTVNDHISEMLTRYNGKASEWDVLNEPCQSRGVLLKGTALGNEKIIKDWFDTARKTDPNAVLYVNEKNIVGADGDNLESFKAIVSGMIKNGVDFDAVGVQGHMGSMPQSPQRLAREIDELAQLGKKVSVTEYDMSTRNDRLQAQYLKHAVMNAYANPNVLGFNMWGHWDVDHEKRTSPMFRDDWTQKPGAYIWKALFDYCFASNIKGKTDQNGNINAKLYEGVYTLKLKKGAAVHEGRLTVDKSGGYSVCLDMSASRLIKKVSFTAGGEKLNELSEWDGISPLKADVTVNDEFSDNQQRKIYAAMYNSDDALIGVLCRSAKKSDGNIAFSFDTPKEVSKISFFVWDNNMIPAYSAAEYFRKRL